MTLRQVKALKFPDIVPGGADMARPRLIDVDPTELLVDETYQRNLSERSRALIRRVGVNIATIWGQGYALQSIDREKYRRLAA